MAQIERLAKQAHSRCGGGQIRLGLMGTCTAIIFCQSCAWPPARYRYRDAEGQPSGQERGQAAATCPLGRIGSIQQRTAAATTFAICYEADRARFKAAMTKLCFST
jgi:hypothetical protein